jgi:pimeloyl-ACP methyl ester carboxylesterase
LPYTKANGLNVYYEQHGEGKPLILLHGGTVSQTMWSQHIPILQKHFNVITPDLRGHGKTDNPYKKFSYRDMAEDLASFIEVTGTKKPLICGYSDGGQVALEYAMNYPGKLGALAIGGVFNKFTKSYFQSVGHMGFKGPGDVDTDATIANNSSDYIEWLRSVHAPGPEYWRTLFVQLSYMWFSPLNYSGADLRRVVVPSLVMVGDGDDLAPVEEAVKLFRGIRGSRLFVAPGCSHGFPLEKVGVFCDVVTEFFNGVNVSQ